MKIKVWKLPLPLLEQKLHHHARTSLDFLWSSTTAFPDLSSLARYEHNPPVLKPGARGTERV